MKNLGVPPGRFSDERTDFHPRSWLSKYRRTSIGYLTKMLLFYHGIGIALLLGGSALIELAIPEYEHPSVSRSLLLVIAAGPIEETIFFGIPFYLIGSAYSLLVTGGVWAAIHLFNTETLQINSLAFANLFFVVPSIFFSLRTWVSGKGWFSVVTHSAWNGIFFGAGCATGEVACTVIEQDVSTSIFWLLGASALVAATYLLYRRGETQERQRLAV